MKPKTLFNFKFDSFDNQSLQAKVFEFRANAVYLHEYRPWWLFWKKGLYTLKPDKEVFAYRNMISEWEADRLGDDYKKRMEYMKRHMFVDVATELFKKFF